MKPHKNKAKNGNRGHKETNHNGSPEDRREGEKTKTAETTMKDSRAGDTIEPHGPLKKPDEHAAGRNVQYAHAEQADDEETKAKPDPKAPEVGTHLPDDPYGVGGSSSLTQAERKRRINQVRRYNDALDRHLGRHGEDPQRTVTVTPPLPTGAKVVDQRTIKEDVCHIRVVHDEGRKEHRYEIIEPELTETETKVLAFLKETLYRTLDGRHDPEDPRDWRDHLERTIDEVIIDHYILIDEVSRTRIKYYLMRDFLGYGTIDALMQDPMIEDISCDGPGIPLYVFHRRFESIRTNVVFKQDDVLDAFVVRLGQVSGKQISLAEPLLDATLPDSSRLQATLSREVTTRGSSFTIRRFRSDPLTPADLVRIGTMDAEMAAFFWLALEAGKSIIYAGGTASGKTTTLNAVCQFIPPEKKVVSIEDTREINLRHENWIAGVSRSGNQDGDKKNSGTVDMYRLLEAALRQRPEFLLVGEVRGVEAKTLFQAMATGHATYSTLHADSARSAVYRLENRPIDIPRIMLQTLDAFAIQVQARVGDRLVRRIKELVEVVGIHPESGDLILNTVFTWDPSTDTYRLKGSSNILRSLMESRNLKREDIEAEMSRRARLLQSLSDAGIRHIDDIADVIRRYYRDAEGAERWVELLIERHKAQEDGAPTEPLQVVAESGGRRQ